VTVTETVALFSPELIVIVALPGDKAFTTPWVFTLAALLELENANDVAGRRVPFSSFAVTCSCSVAPIANFADAGRIEIVAGGDCSDGPLALTEVPPHPVNNVNAIKARKNNNQTRRLDPTAVKMFPRELAN
jgi:hypothetical protein